MQKSHIGRNLSIIFFIVISALAAANWYVQPEKGLNWLIPVIIIPSLWVLMATLSASGTCADEGECTPSQLYTGIGSAGALLSMALGLVLMENLTLITDAFGDKVFGVSMGLFIMIIGNKIPKKMVPLKAERQQETETQALRRFAGWVFVLDGMGYALCYLMFTDDKASQLTMVLGVSSLALILIRMLIGKFRQQQA